MVTYLRQLSHEQLLYRAENQTGDPLIAELAERFDSLLNDIQDLSTQLECSTAEISRLNRTSRLLESRIIDLQTATYA